MFRLYGRLGLGKGTSQIECGVVLSLPKSLSFTTSPNSISFLCGTAQDCPRVLVLSSALEVRHLELPACTLCRICTVEAVGHHPLAEREHDMSASRSFVSGSVFCSSQPPSRFAQVLRSSRTFVVSTSINFLCLAALLTNSPSQWPHSDWPLPTSRGTSAPKGFARVLFSSCCCGYVLKMKKRI